MGRIRQWQVDFPHKRPVICNFDIFFVFSLNKLLNKQSSYRWFYTPLRTKDLITLVVFCVHEDRKIIITFPDYKKARDYSPSWTRMAEHGHGQWEKTLHCHISTQWINPSYRWKHECYLTSMACLWLCGINNSSGLIRPGFNCIDL